MDRNIAAGGSPCAGRCCRAGCCCHVGCCASGYGCTGSCHCTTCCTCGCRCTTCCASGRHRVTGTSARSYHCTVHYTCSRRCTTCCASSRHHVTGTSACSYHCTAHCTCSRRCLASYAARGIRNTASNVRADPVQQQLTRQRIATVTVAAATQARRKTQLRPPVQTHPYDAIDLCGVVCHRAGALGARVRRRSSAEPPAR